MGRKNKRWKCLTCGERMHVEFSNMRKVHGETIVHLCGTCKAKHLVTDAGDLRKMTPAETLRLEMQMGPKLRVIEAMEFPLTGDRPEGTLML